MRPSDLPVLTKEKAKPHTPLGASPPCAWPGVTTGHNRIEPFFVLRASSPLPGPQQAGPPPFPSHLPLTIPSNFLHLHRAVLLVQLRVFAFYHTPLTRPAQIARALVQFLRYRTLYLLNHRIEFTRHFLFIMKTFAQLTLAVTLAATVTASSHHHGHRHLHAKKDATKVDKRDADIVTHFVAGPTKIVYQLAGKVVNADEAKKGLDNGEYVVVGESTPTYTPPPAPSTSKDLGAQFLESKSATITTTPPPSPLTTTSTPPPPPPSSTAQAPVANSAASSNDDDSSSSSGGEDVDFPSGKVKCSEFPSKYGAVPIPWMELGGWVGAQRVANYPDALSFDNIVEAIAGQGCSSGDMCSYACKPGYQKSQWPKIQGATGQSVGGIYCNSEGYLELTRPSVKQLCTAGEGGVFIKNDLDDEVATCRTNYPGNENMNIPTVAKAGETVPLTNPSQSKYYQWKNMKTSAQYYINPKGVAAKDACIWKSPISPNDRGNWAAVVAGVGKADDGITYISLFLNKPTSSAKPDFNMEIIGGNTKCGYHNGQWIGGTDGCTTGLDKGQTATIRYY